MIAATLCARATGTMASASPARFAESAVTISEATVAARKRFIKDCCETVGHSTGGGHQAQAALAVVEVGHSFNPKMPAKTTCGPKAGVLLANKWRPPARGQEPAYHERRAISAH